MKKLLAEQMPDVAEMRELLSKCMVRPGVARFLGCCREQFASIYPASREWTAVADRP